MELCFADVESTFDYFRATRRYLGAARVEQVDVEIA